MPNIKIKKDQSTLKIATVGVFESGDAMGPAGGDLGGAYPNPDVVAVQGVAVDPTAPTAGQVLTAGGAANASWQDATGTGGGSGWIYIEDIQGQGGVVVSGKVFQDTLGNVLQSCNASGNDVRVQVRSSYPLIKLNGADVQLPRVGDAFEDLVDLTLAGGTVTATVVDPDGVEQASDNATVTVDAPPQLLTLEFTGGYPGSQTELKQGDTFQVTGTTDKPADAIEIQNFGASTTTQLLTFASGTSFTVTMVIGDQGDSPQLLAARATARDSVSGAFGPSLDTDASGSANGVNVVNLNNLFPSGSVSSIDYPATQQALKGAEQATVNHTAADFDTIAYVDPTGTEVSIANPSTFEAAKAVDRIGGTFNILATNFRYTMNRAANDATTIVSDVVQIANVAPTITVATPAARLRSGGNDGTSAQSYSIALVADQPLLSAPSLEADSGGNRGTFLGSWSGSGTTWSRTLRVDEGVPDEKGTFQFESLAATGLAGLVQNTIGSGEDYTLGGFVARTITVPAFASSVQFGVEVVDFAKVEADNFSPGGPSVKQPIGTVADTVNGYTIDAVGVNPTTLVLLDQAAVAANSLGLYNLSNLEEAV